MNKSVQETQDQEYMDLALVQAQHAESLGEVPIGAVLVINERVIASAGNRRELWQDPTAHAELIVLREAAKRMESWRLDGATLYVTLEPCVMCMGGIILSRIPRLVYGARDPKAGAVGSIYNLAVDERFNHNVDVTQGVRGKECGEILTTFFRQLRHKKKADKLLKISE